MAWLVHAVDGAPTPRAPSIGIQYDRSSSPYGVDMSHALTEARHARASIGTNAPIEQPFAAMMAGRRPRSPNVLYLDVALTAAEIGAYAGVETTPRIDRFARSGVRFAAVSPGGVSGAVLPKALRQHGYDSDAFRPATNTAGVLDVGPVVSFIAQRRTAPWAAYVRLAAGSSDRLDLAVGRLIYSLRRVGAYRHTIVAFIGDPTPGDTFVPTMVSWPGQIPPRQRHDAPIRVADMAHTLVETACSGAARTLDDGVDFTMHLFDGEPMPGRTTSAVESSAA